MNHHREQQGRPFIKATWSDSETQISLINVPLVQLNAVMMALSTVPR